MIVITGNAEEENAVKAIALGADAAGKISVGFRLGNINLKPEEIAILLFTFPQVIFHEAKIKYEDNSLVERLMKLGAQKEQTSVENFKKSLMQKLEKEIEKEKDDFTKKALNEINKFLENPEEFSISASPLWLDDLYGDIKLLIQVFPWDN